MVANSELVGPKLDLTFEVNPFRGTSRQGTVSVFVRVFLHLLAGEGVWGRGRHFGLNPSRGTLAILLNPDSSAWGQRPLPQEYEPARQGYSGCRNRPCSWGENNKRLPPWQRADPQLHPSLRLRLFSLLHPAPDRSLLPSHGGGESLCRRVRSPSGKNQPRHRW